MKHEFAFAAAIAFFGTLFSIVVAYVDYEFLFGGSIRLAFEDVGKWPLVGLSIVLTSVSLLVPFAINFFRKQEDPTGNLILYAFGYVWIPLLIFAPESQGLAISSHGAGALAYIGVVLSQLFAARKGLKAIEALQNSNAV